MHSQYLSITSWNYSISKMSTLRGLDADFLFLKDFYIYQNGVVAKSAPSHGLVFGVVFD